MGFESPYQLLSELQDKVSVQSQLNKSLADDRWRGVSFELAGHTFITSVVDVSEIIPCIYLHPLPGVKPWVKGVIQIRGELIIINDLSAFIFGKEAKLTDKSRILIKKYQNEKVGFLIEKVFGMQIIHKDATRPLHDSDFDKPYIHQAYEQENSDIPILDMHALISHPSFLHVNER